MPLQPLCLLCLSECDGQGGYTSCGHFFCSRCASRLPPPSSAPCPHCHRNYQLLSLATPSLQPLYQDPHQLLEPSIRTVQAQTAYYQQTIGRMREALRLLNSRYQASEKQLGDARQELTSTKEMVQGLQQKLQKQWEQMEDLRGQAQAAAASSSESRHSRPGPGATPWMQPQHPGNTTPRLSPLGWSATSAAVKRTRSSDACFPPRDSGTPTKAPFAPMTPIYPSQSSRCGQAATPTAVGQHFSPSVAAHVGKPCQTLPDQRQSGSGGRPAFRLSTPLVTSLNMAQRTSTDPSTELSRAGAPKSLQGLLGGSVR